DAVHGHSFVVLRHGWLQFGRGVQTRLISANGPDLPRFRKSPGRLPGSGRSVSGSGRFSPVARTCVGRVREAAVKQSVIRSGVSGLGKKTGRDSGIDVALDPLRRRKMLSVRTDESGGKGSLSIPAIT